MPHNHFAILSQSTAHEPELTPAMSRLVQVHEVHVDRRPGNVSAELRVQMGDRVASSAVSPAIHILAGENVCIHVTSPMQFFALFASRQIR